MVLLGLDTASRELLEAEGDRLYVESAVHMIDPALNVPGAVDSVTLELAEALETAVMEVELELCEVVRIAALE